MSTPSLPPLAARRSLRARGGLRGWIQRGGVLLAVLVGVLTFSVGPAQALAGPVGPVTIGRTVAAVGGEAVATSSVGGPVAVGVTAAVVAGIALYETRDVWLPWVNNLMNDGASSSSDSGSKCATGSPTVSGGTLSMQITATCDKGWTGYNLSAEFTNVTCKGGGPTNFAGNQKSNNWVVYLNTVVTLGPYDFCGAAGVASYSYDFSTAQGANWIGGTTGSGSAPWSAAANTQKTDVTCKSALDGTTKTLSNTEQGHPERWVMPSCESAYGNAWHPASGTVSVGPSAGTQNPVATFTDHTLDDFKDCFDPSSGAAQCRVKVFVNGQACTADNILCQDWKQAKTDGETVECRYGSHVVPLGNCDALTKAYTTTIPATVTSTNPDGSPKTDPAPATDPGAFPTTGANPAPAPEPAAAPAPEDTNSNCMAGAWSWNPVDWVYVPVKCALKWAFVPKTAVSARMTEVSNRVSTKAPVTWLSGFANVPASIPDNGCPDWRIKVGPVDQNVVCPSSYTDAIRSARPVLLVFMVSLAFWPLIRGLAYAAIPVLKPHPGSR